MARDIEFESEGLTVSKTVTTIRSARASGQAIAASAMRSRTSFQKLLAGDRFDLTDPERVERQRGRAVSRPTIADRSTLASRTTRVTRTRGEPHALTRTPNSAAVCSWSAMPRCESRRAATPIRAGPDPRSRRGRPCPDGARKRASTSVAISTRVAAATRQAQAPPNASGESARGVPAVLTRALHLADASSAEVPTRYRRMPEPADSCRLLQDAANGPEQSLRRSGARRDVEPDCHGKEGLSSVDPAGPGDDCDKRVGTRPQSR